MSSTLLQLVQDVASSMDSDEVTSINDSTESLQIATVVKTTYFDIINRLKLPRHYTVFNLQATSATTPVVMTLPTDVNNVEWLKYDYHTLINTDVNYQDVKFLPIREFLALVNRFRVDSVHVASMSFTPDLGNSFTFYYSNNIAPQYYTSVDDVNFIFDSYDLTVDAFLTSSKSMAFGQKKITWNMSDGFTPDLDEVHFPLLLNEAKALAWTELKQTQHPKAEQSARRHWIHAQKAKYAIDNLSDFNKFPNYGRR